MSEASKPWEPGKAGGSGDDALTRRFVQSLSDDIRLWRQDIAGSRAHARMLRSVGLIDEAACRALEDGLTEIEGEIEATGVDWQGWREELEDVHMCIEAALIEKVGDAGRMLHTGRSRNDQVATDLKRWIGHEAIPTLETRLDALFRGFVTLAERQGDLVFPGYTHMQRAQPITLGGEVVAWLTAFYRCLGRLDALRHVNADNPLGSGALAGTGLPLDRTQTADALGVGEPSMSSIEATASRDAVIDFVYGLSMTAQWLSRWAEQWILYQSHEFGFLRTGEAYVTGSSMMPQKQNPDMLELIRGRCGEVYGSLVSLLTMTKGLPIGYSRDLQADKRPLFAAYDTVHDALAIAAGLVESATFDERRVRGVMEGGFLDATGLADYLVRKGMPFRTAHQRVADLVARCRAKGVDRLADLTVEEMHGVCDAIQPDVTDWLGAEKVVRRYQTAGNAGVSGSRAALTRWRQWLDASLDSGVGTRGDAS